MIHNFVCNKCLFDSTVPELKVDTDGICNYCHLHDRFKKFHSRGQKGRFKLLNLVKKIKASSGKKYDCIVGVSGGVDSSFTLYLAVRFGLKPLAVHIDNGWNSELAVENIQNITDKLGVDLHTEVLNWKSFKDLQLSFLKASVPDGEIPTDMTLISSLFKMARKSGVSYVIAGFNTGAQGVSPIGWTYMDKKYIYSVQKKHGHESIKNINFLSISDLIYTTFVKRIRTVSFLENINYRTEKAKLILNKELGWRPYEGKHYESIYTKFFQGYILPQKFKIDKRKIYLSTLLRDGKISRENADLELSTNPYPSKDDVEKDKQYVMKKLDINEQEFSDIMKLPIKSYRDYDTYLSVINLFRYPIKVVCNLGILPLTFYEKYIKILEK